MLEVTLWPSVVLVERVWRGVVLVVTIWEFRCVVLVEVLISNRL